MDVCVSLKTRDNMDFIYTGRTRFTLVHYEGLMTLTQRGG